MTTSQFAAVAAALLLSASAFSVQAQAASAPTAAEPATQPAPAPVAKNAHDPNQVICKYEDMTGSRLGGQKLCYTRAQWEQMSRDSAATTTLMQNRQVNASGH